MPSTYAHYRFGKQAFGVLPQEARSCIQRFRRMYEMGQYGPDFFFYYNPLWKTSVGDLGASFHSQTGEAFFTRACNEAASEAAKAYLFGLVGHYALDSMSHPVVNRVVKTGEARHVALESEFDRYLLAADKIPEPHLFDLSERIRLTRGECVTVSAFYPPATPGQVNQSVRHMRKFQHFLTGKKREKNKKLVKRWKIEYLDNFIPEAPVAEFNRLDSELLVRWNWAQELYPQMVQSLLDHMKTGAPLGENFQKPFG